MLFEDYQLDGILYFDSDIRVYRRLTPIFDALEQSNIVLTPHLTEPILDDGRPNELDILRAGTYNLGFIALANRGGGRAFLKWWQRRVFDECVIDLDRSLNCDQRRVDLVPGLFDKVRILRDPGMNLAYWNIQQRHVECSSGVPLVNGAPLYFFHFSGFKPDAPGEFSRHQNRFRTQDLGEASTLVRDYRKELLQRGYGACKQWPYAYGSFTDGTPIPDVARRVHREDPSLPNTVADPFSAVGFKAFVRTWNCRLESPSGPSGLTKLAHRIYSIRPDLRAAMPDVLGSDRPRYLEWFVGRAKQDYDLPEALVAPVRELLNQDGPARATVASELDRLMHQIYHSRPDLQRAFPSPWGDDRVNYRAWLLGYGRLEYPLLKDSYSAGLWEEWREALRATPSWVTRWWQRGRLATFLISGRLGNWA